MVGKHAKKKKRKLTAWQKHVKSYMSQHPGLSFKEALPKAKLTYKGSNPSRSRKVTKTKTKKRKGKMARKKRNRKAGASIQQTFFKWLRIGALAAPGLAYAIRDTPRDQKIDDVIQAYTGFRPIALVWDPKKLVHGWGPFVVANLMTHGIPKLVSIIRRL